MSTCALAKKAVLALACLVFCVVPAFAAETLGSAATWIWSTTGAKNDQVVYFRKTFTVEGPAKSASLFATCDNGMKVFLNGQQVAESTEWEQPVKVDVSKHLKAGENVVAVRGTNEGSAAGLLVQLDIVKKDGSKQSVVTDKSWTSSEKESPEWQTAKADAAGWKATQEIAKFGGGPWGDKLGAGGVAGAATAAESLVLLPGFKAERLYSVPKATEGSWINMTNDPKGRLYVSAQEGTLFRVTVGADEAATKVEKVNLPIGSAQGLLWAFDSLYVVINGGFSNNPPGLYRLQDTNGDDVLDKFTLIKKINGGGEHGPHAVRLGPDGKTLYVIAGNHTPRPDGLAPDSPHKNFSEDHLLKRNPDGNGHATGVMAPGGWICKTDETGSRWELWCAGFRNEYDIDFNEDGELFAYDADMEYDIGSPWYRPTRVCLAVSGGEFGWRYGTGKWPAYYPDSLPAVVNTGIGSPTGISFGRGAKFPAKYQHALFVNDWAYGKVYAVHMTPTGASYTGTFETFVEGRPFNVTDIIVNNDGAMYITIGGRGTQSGLYRVTYTGSEPTAAAAPVKNEEAAAAREFRHKLESFHGRKDAAAVDFAWPHLDSPDRFIRYAARIAIEWQPPDQWQQKALEETSPTASINALVALARCGDKSLQPKVIDALNRLPIETLSEEQTLEALRAYGLCFIRMGKPDTAVAAATLDRLDKLFPTTSNVINRELVQVLIYLKSPTIVKRAMDQLSSAQTQEDQLHYAFVLRNPAPNWTADERKAYFSWIRHAETAYTGGASFPRFLQQIKDDVMSTLTAEEKAAVRPILTAPAPASSVVKNVKPRKFVKNWQMADLLPVLEKATKGRNFERGREAFEATQCIACHRFNNTGGVTGPDITGVGARFAAQDVLDSILEPSKVISDQYAATEVITKDRRLVSGYIEKDDADSITVRTNPLSEASRVTVKKADITKRRLSKLSPMPTGLVDILSEDEILDLIAYVRSGGKKEDKAFAN